MGWAMPVLGIGGVFFRAKDPAAQKAWYREHLGVGAGMGTDDAGESNAWVWYAKGGATVFEPFRAETDYFPAAQQVMLNLRVSDLDGLITSLRAAGIEVITKPEWDSPEVGRFARVHDPEGNAVELWEPAAEG
jgi:predicted enzyme related to lactoylglutathione lyase